MCKPSDEISTARVSPAVARALSFLFANYHRPLTIREVAGAAGISHTRLTHQFRAELGQSPKRQLTAIRIERAKELLSTSDLPVKQIAALVGISLDSLEDQFGRVHRASPSGYRSMDASQPLTRAAAAIFRC